MRAGTAKDVIRPDSQETALRANDPLDRALRLMLEMDLLAVPVVDDEGRILGDLTLSRVLRYILSLSEDEARQLALSSKRYRLKRIRTWRMNEVHAGT